MLEILVCHLSKRVFKCYSFWLISNNIIQIRVGLLGFEHLRAKMRNFNEV